jgi:hypothetical protein
VVSRRTALGAAATALLLTGCGSDGRPAEGARLESYTGLVQAQLFTYEAGAAAGYEEARAALPTQRRRVESLRALVEEAGGTPPLPPEQVADVDRVLPGLAEVRSRADFHRFTGELEAVVSAARAQVPTAIP